MMAPTKLTLHINGEEHSIVASPDMPLLWVLRDVIGLTGTKYGCGIAQCGACTVHLDGNAIRSCVMPVGSLGNSQVMTIERLDSSELGRRLQSAWLQLQVPQCGYCQSGQLMSAAALLVRTPEPRDADIDAAMSGNICRCCTYTRIRAAIHKAARP
jgi:isoquinoline 1-oxidoreductase alpha subunit